MRLFSIPTTKPASRQTTTLQPLRKPLSTKTVTATISLLLAVIASGCAQKVEPIDPLLIPGTNTVASTLSADAEKARIVELLAANQSVSLMAAVDHSKNALGTEFKLPPSHTLIFGNPALGTKLMQANQTVALDLPQKILITQLTKDNEEEQPGSRLRWNNADYLRTRHNLSGVDETLETIDKALSTLAAGDNSPIKKFPSNVGINKSGKRHGIVEKLSDIDFATTVAQLREQLAAHNALTIFAEIDHQANAKKAGLKLRPTLLFIVGNPVAGTPLMHDSPSTGLDLPQKILVYQNDDERVRVAYNQPLYIAERHGISDQKKLLKKIALTLGEITTKATDEVQKQVVDDRIPVPRIRQNTGAEKAE